MRDYWNALQPRERVIITIASLLIAALVFYLSLLEPYMDERNNLEKRIANQQEDLQWMREAAGHFKGAKSQAGTKRTGGQSLLSFVDRSTKELALNSAVKRIQPEGQKVRIQFEKVSFDRLTAWLAKIETAGYRIDGVVIERQPEQGKVNARIVIGSAI